MKRLGMILIGVMFLAGCTTPKVVSDGVKYELNEQFKSNMDSEFIGYAMRWSGSPAGSAAIKRRVVEYLETDEGTRLFERKISSYFKSRAALSASIIMAFAGVLAAGATGIGWWRTHIKWKKSNGNGDH